MSSSPDFTRYNGWHNYETWCVNLWMSNDAGSDEFYRELAQQAWNDSEPETRNDGSALFTRDEIAIRTLADRLKDNHEEQQAELTGIMGIFADLLTTALGEVDWHEIAEHYISDVDKSAESEAA
jgi:hypothetical protein